MRKKFTLCLCLALVGCGAGVAPVEQSPMKRNDDSIPFRPLSTGGIKAGLVPDSAVTEDAMGQYAVMPFPLNGGFENFSQDTSTPDHWNVGTSNGATGVWGTNVLRETTLVRSGLNSIRFKPSVSASAMLETELIPVSPGQKPIINFWAKVNAVDTSFTGLELDITFYDNNGVSLYGTPLNTWVITTTSGWTQYRGAANGLAFPPPNGFTTTPAKYVKFSIQAWSGTGGLTDICIDDVVAAWVMPQEDYTPAILNSPWANYGGGTYAASYMMDSMGFVNVRGGVKSGTIGTAVLNLPTGYRPVGIARFITSASGGAFAETQVDSNGDIKFNTVSSGSNALIFLDGIRFKAEQ